MEDTSLEAYRKIDLNERERLVLAALDAHKEPPTSYELAQYMYEAGTAIDLNSTRPRLTDLKNKGVVEKTNKRQCMVTGNTAYVWRRKVKEIPNV